MEIIRTLIVGIVMGIENVIPGVSGGTMAAVFNIYDQFVDAFTLNIKKIWRNKKFVFPLFGGMLMGVLIFASLVSILYEKFEVQTQYFFTGLILGSLPCLFGYMIEKKDGKKFSAGKICVLVACVIVAFGILVFIGRLEGNMEAAEMASALPEQTWFLTLKLFIAGVLGAVAMIIPGVSGSLVNLMMGVYPIIMKSIPSLFVPNLFLKSLLLLLPNGIGLLVGLVSAAKLIGFILKKLPNQSYAFIFGLICASAVNIFPGFTCLATPGKAIGSIISLVVGAVLTFFCSKLAKKEDTDDEKIVEKIENEAGEKINKIDEKISKIKEEKKQDGQPDSKSEETEESGEPTT